MVNLEINLIILALLLVGSAFFSGVETALISISKSKVRTLLNAKKRGAEALARLKENPHKMLITILIGNNLVNVAASVYATVVTLEVFPNQGIGIATGFMTLFILIFGEITPKSFATKHTETIALLTARLIELMALVLWPFIKALEIVTGFILKLIGGPMPDTARLTEEEIRTIVTMGAEEGAIKTEEKEMIQNIFRFDDLPVRNVMIPFVEMEVIDGKKKLDDILDFLSTTSHSRIPVYEDDERNIIGVYYVSKTLKLIREKKENKQIKTLIEPAYFVPENKKIDSLLHDFRKMKVHMALVVDEYGTVTGLITLEDVLEQIVGDIEDETDIEEPDIVKISAGKYKIQGTTSLLDVNDELKLKLKSKFMDSIGGIVMEELDRVPKKGDKVHLDKVHITVTKMKGNMVDEIELIL